MAELEFPHTLENTPSYLSETQIGLLVEANVRPIFSAMRKPFSSEVLQTIPKPEFQILNIFQVGTWVIFEGSTQTQAINIAQEPFMLQDTSIEEREREKTENITIYQEKLLSIEILIWKIWECLEQNQNEVWEVIDENDKVESMTLVEAVLLLRKKLQDAGDIRRFLIIPEWDSTVQETDSQLFNFQEEYLLLSLWVGKSREELVHVIPKSQAETNQLIEGIITRKTPEEILAWMKNIHSEVNANNFQDALVEKNMTYFIERMNAVVLTRFEQEVFEKKQQWWEYIEGPYYHNPQILFDFAGLVSGRTGWVWSSLMSSDMDSRLWRADIANEALVLAMKVPNKDTEMSLLDTISPQLNIEDSELREKTPSQIIEWFQRFTLQNVTLSDENGNMVAMNQEKLNEIINILWYSSLFEKYKSGDISTYQDATLEEKIQISALARVVNTLSQETRIEMWNFTQLQTGETSQILPGPPFMTEIFSPGGQKIGFDRFTEIIQNAWQESVSHIGWELDRNFDDGFWEKMGDFFLGSVFYETPEERAESFWIETQSLEFEIFSLYNDIQWNGNLGEIGDSTRDTLKTAGYMMAMIAGSMVLWGGVLLAASRAGVMISTMATQWVIYGISWSTMWYVLDATLGDTRGFYTPEEAFMSVGTDYALGAFTGALGWAVANRYWNPNAALFSRESIPNQYIFAGDITLNGIVPEMYRLRLMDQVWWENEIFTPENENWNFLNTRLERKIQEYQNNIWLGSLLSDVFFETGIQKENVPSNLEKRFQKAFAIYGILNPRNDWNIFSEEEEFHGISDIAFLQTELSNPENYYILYLVPQIEKWCDRQENRWNQLNIWQ